MASIFTKAALAVLVGFSGMAAIPAAASASDIGFYIGVGGPGHHYRGAPPRYFHGRHFRDGVCTNRHAVMKARESGLRHARVVHRGPGRVVVEGKRHRGYDRTVFANNARCSVIRW